MLEPSSERVGKGGRAWEGLAGGGTADPVAGVKWAMWPRGSDRLKGCSPWRRPPLPLRQVFTLSGLKGVDGSGQVRRVREAYFCLGRTPLHMDGEDGWAEEYEVISSRCDKFTPHQLCAIYRVGKS